MHDRSLSDREVIYRAGDSPDAIFVVIRGAVTLSTPRGGGDWHSEVLGAGSVFGAGEAIAGQCRTANAAAIGETVLRIYTAAEALAAVTADRNRFDRLLASALQGPLDPPNSANRSVNGVRLIAAAPEITQWLGDGGLRIADFPFVIGRKDEESERHRIGLTLRDRRPYQLSRRHFMINEGDSGYEVCDCGSNNGTIVNGAKLGGGTTTFRMVLNAGENEIIAGTASSPFRFLCLVETDTAP